MNEEKILKWISMLSLLCGLSGVVLWILRSITSYSSNPDAFLAIAYGLPIVGILFGLVGIFYPKGSQSTKTRSKFAVAFGILSYLMPLILFVLHGMLFGLH